MNKLTKIAAAAAIAAIPLASANATSYCGYPTEAGDNTFPAYVTINGHNVTSLKELNTGNLGDGGEAYRGNQRYCGQMFIYVIPGTNISGNWFVVDVDLHPDIIKFDVNQVKCSVSLASVSPVYTTSVGLPHGSWYDNHPVTAYIDDFYGYTGSENPPRRHTFVTVAYSGALLSGYQYGLELDCPTNIPQQQQGG